MKIQHAGNGISRFVVFPAKMEDKKCITFQVENTQGSEAQSSLASFTSYIFDMNVAEELVKNLQSAINTIKG